MEPPSHCIDAKKITGSPSTGVNDDVHVTFGSDFVKEPISAERRRQALLKHSKFRAGGGRYATNGKHSSAARPQG